MQFLEALNPEQLAAVLHIHGPLLILAGAGSMSTVIVFAHQADGWAQWGGVVLGIVVNSLLCWGFLRFSDRLLQLLGHTGMNVISRLMGMILVAMAVQFVHEFLKKM